ncbi:MAG: hypothetical protein ACI9ON_001149 [Limisphaerales bacterium]|jgi:hypothetical protein
MTSMTEQQLTQQLALQVTGLQVTGKAPTRSLTAGNSNSWRGFYFTSA